MAQAPATPKRLRLTHLAAAALHGPAVAAQRPGLAASERAALELRAGAAGHRPAPAEAVVFLVPLVARAQVGDWGAVSARLAQTLESFRAQSDPRWMAVICGQDRPEGLPQDPRIRFLPFTERVEGNDKWNKLAALAAALPQAGPRAGYAMSFDADDLLHRRAVAHMLEGQARGGYLVARGYVEDLAAGRIGRAGPPSLATPLRKPFWKLCGSCAALRFDLDAPHPETAFLGAMLAHEHRMFPYLARLAGRRLTPFGFAAALYMLNHGENFGARRGRIGFKPRFVRRFEVTDPAEKAEIARSFPARARSAA